MRELPGIERWRVDYALRSTQLVHERWTQFEKVDPCVLLIGTEAHWVLNCEAAPADYVRTAERFRDHPVFLRVGGKFATSDGQSLEPSVMVRTVPATVWLPPTKRSASRHRERPFLLVSTLEALERWHPGFSAHTNTEKWLGIVVHEYFHILELQALGESSPPTRAALSQLYMEDAAYRRLLDEEYRVLAGEVARADIDLPRARAALGAWSERYRARRDYLSALPGGEELVRLDTLFTYLEGLARYVENGYLLDVRQHPRDDRRIDPGFRGFSEYAGRGYSDMPNRELTEDYYYALGAHIALLLDRVAPDWSRDVQTAPDWLLGSAMAKARETYGEDRR